MSDPSKSMKQDVFRFVALRPPTPTDETDPLSRPVRDARNGEDTVVGRLVAELGERPTRGRFEALLRREVAERGLTPSPPDDDVATALTVLGNLLDRGLTAEEATDMSATTGLLRVVEDVLGASPAEFLADEHVSQIRAELWDRLQVFYLLGRRKPQNLEELVSALRALRLVELLAADTMLEPGDLRRISAATLVLPVLGAEAESEPRVQSSRLEAQQKADQEKADEFSALWSDFLDLNEGLSMLRQTRFTASFERKEPEEGPSFQDDASKDTANRQPPGPERPSARPVEETVRRRLPDKTLENLPGAAKQLVATLPLGQSLSDKPLVMEEVQWRLAAVADQIISSTDPLMFEVMPPAAAELPGMQALSSKYASKAPLDVAYKLPLVPFPWVTRPVIRPLGIGDLKVVKQTLQRYVAGEVAHVENVLDGESKERTHRRLDRTEQTFTIETETVEETERDNQTTDRFELKKESERTIQEDMSIDAGITVSASYGPVELGAYANFAYSQSSSETTKNSQNFARDVVDRSLTKIQKRTREERVTKTIKEIEESNVHGINNAPAGNGHVTGIYRWLDKHYEAQVYNYGRRMMFEFVIPEPAAYYYYSQENDPTNKINAQKPRDLALLSHKDVQSWNFGAYVRAYNVQGITPPPPQWRVVPITFDQNSMADDATSSKSSKELIVPDGYVARSWGYNWSAWQGSSPYLQIVVGLESADGSTFDLDGEEGVVPVSLITHDVRAYAANIEVFCERTARAFEVWQIQTFEKIVAAYEAARTAYEDKVKAAEVARGVVIEGRNPGINLQIIRNELKKQSITLLTGEDYTTFNSVSGVPPIMDLREAAEESTFIQFFEQAFEWEQLTYLFYPYFWARTTTWNKRLGFNDPDPQFNQFLQSGAARVVVPVHPAYNEAIVHFVETGELWNGGSPPHIDDPLFVSIVEELKAQTDDLDGAVPEGEPWRVVVPTTLVYLQADATLPDFTK